MLLIQDVLGQRNQPCYLSHIQSRTKLPGISNKENDKIDCIMTASIELLEQARMLYQQFHLSTQNLYRLLPELLVSQYKYLFRSCASWVSLAPPKSSGSLLRSAA